MTKNLDKDGLRSIVENYDLFFIDIWGVVHNGISLYNKAINTLIEIEKWMLSDKGRKYKVYRSRIKQAEISIKKPEPVLILVSNTK